MTSPDRDPELQDPQSLINQLAEAASHTNEDDLPELAKMHKWCETLAEVCSADPVPESAFVGDQARMLLGQLESLILREMDDAGQAFATVVASISELAEIFGGGPGDESPPAEEPATSEGAGDDESVEAKLAKIFDDPPPSEEPDGTEEAPAPAPEQPADSNTQAETPADAQAETPAPQEPSYEPVPLTLNEDELDFVKGFVEESSEHIEAIEAAMLVVEEAPEDSEKINDLFRPFHTIKGIAGFLNLRDINCLTHEVETLLDQGRKGERKITPGLIDVVFDVVDILKVQLTSVGEWAVSPHDQTIPQPPVSGMIDKLRGLVSSLSDPGVSEADSGSATQETGENPVEQDPAPQDVADPAPEPQPEAEQPKKSSETPADVKAATPKQASPASPPQAPTRAKEPTGPAGGQKAIGDQSIRIDTAKLDILVDMVGELVIAQTLVNENEKVTSAAALAKDVSQVTKIVREVQEVAMAMRMVPIGPTFQKMARLVRDVSRKAGKQVNLTISGEDTELDKTVIQQIGDPLVHMVRNAVDHGIEAPEERRAAGKPDHGELHLGARHEGGNIVIEIIDDGKGLDPQSLIKKSIEKGIVQPGEELTDTQAYNLIFAAGFSMAKEITDISGRGVGMDVVKRNIDQLRGKVDITSEIGNGSTFSIRLPLTLAIIDGMIIRVGGERFIVPIIGIEKSLRPLSEQITTVLKQGEVLNVRGQLIPLIQLGELFGLTDRIDPSEAMVVVVHCEGRQIGLVVQELIGQQQVVIKTLGERFEGLRGISGSAILGDGKVGLILEMPGLVAAHQAMLNSPNRPRQRNRGPAEKTASAAEPETPDPEIETASELVGA